MTPDVAKRIVHELQGWDRSINDARSALGYDPAWWIAEAIDWDGSPPEPQLAIWFATHRRAFQAATDNALSSLGLSGLFGSYWRACFLSYREGDLSTIEERVPFLGQSGVRRAYPPVHSMLSVTLHSDDAGNRLTISGPAEFVTAETLTNASERARRLVSRIDVHSLIRLRGSRPGQMAKAAKDTPAKVLARELAGKGMTLNQIVKQLETKFDPQPDRKSVRAWTRGVSTRRP